MGAITSQEEQQADASLGKSPSPQIQKKSPSLSPLDGPRKSPPFSPLNGPLPEPASVAEFERQVSECMGWDRQVSVTHGVCTSPTGGEGTKSYRIKFENADGSPISPWHDIQLHTADPGVFRMIVEIPKMTKEKFEISTKEEGNPIAQDIKKGKLREYHGPIFWNYGMFPQTWEDPSHEHPELKVNGDNDPLDVVEIGSEALAHGSIVKVKVLGVLAMIDDGELDWKVIAIRKEDPLADKLKDIDDVESQCPGVISGIREWLRWYKTPDGKPLNKFGFDEKALNREKALEVVDETHRFWQKLRSDKATVEENALWISAYGDDTNNPALGA